MNRGNQLVELISALNVYEYYYMKNKESVTFKQIFNLWLPLAGSWFLMGIETPVLDRICCDECQVQRLI